MADILLLTGRPGVGKTTLIRRLADDLGRSAGGFYTEEIRDSGERVGFRLVTLDGRAAIFAHTGWARRTPHRVGRYGVHLAVLNRIGLVAVKKAVRRRQAILVDEIGKMELLSDTFRGVMEEVASGPSPLVAAITLAPHPWAEAFKNRACTTVHELTRTNRERIFDEAQVWLSERMNRTRRAGRRHSRG